MKKIFLIFTGTIFLYSSLILPSCSGDKSETSDIDSTGLPGDNLSLVAVVDLFKESKDPEDFEKRLNTTKKVNNLDLNGDSKTDYIRVKDETNGTGHAIILQVLVNDTEFQDVAVISLVKKTNDIITLQIKGNEYMYGENVIVEPKPEEDEKKGEASVLPEVFHTAALGVEVNVSLWAPVAYVYNPVYVSYVSPVVWESYPVWYSPWPPYPYNVYTVEVAHHKKHYIYQDIFYPNPAFQIYYNNRQNSIFVLNRYDNFYKEKGWPKMKGKPIYGPGSAGKFHNNNHFGDHWNQGNHGNKDKSDMKDNKHFKNEGNGHTKMKEKGNQSHENHDRPYSGGKPDRCGHDPAKGGGAQEKKGRQQQGGGHQQKGGHQKGGQQQGGGNEKKGK
ncbi:MAG: hypothetical protein SGJ10_14605 [Bacteroidota bacterium]|nr:hypothetical protein [Bacteroidota bacterium]